MESRLIRVDDPAGSRSLEARVEIVGEDLVVAVGGGERPHVGVVVLAQPVASRAPSSSVLTIPPHKEEPIARGIAEKLAAMLGRVTVVTAGIHDDDIDADGIACYIRLGEELAESLVQELSRLPRSQ